MNKGVVSFIYSFVSGLFFLYLQVLFMQELAIMNVVPMILLPWLIDTVWRHPWEVSIPSVFLIALLYDSLNPLSFGLTLLIFIVLTIVIDWLKTPFEHDSVLAKFIAIISCNLLYCLMNLLAYGLMWKFSQSLLSACFGSFVYNLIFCTIIFWAIQLITRLRLVLKND